MIIPRHQDGSLVVSIGILEAIGQKKDFRKLSLVPLDRNFKPTRELPWLSIDNNYYKGKPFGNLIEEWYVKLKVRKPIIPLVEDWGTCLKVMNNALGFDPVTNAPVFFKMFDQERRIDINAIMYFLTDVSAYYGDEQLFYWNLKARHLPKLFKIKRYSNTNPYGKSENLSEIYRAIQRNFLVQIPEMHQIH